MISSGRQVRLGEIGGHEIRLDLIAFGIFAIYVLGGPASLKTGIAFLVGVFLSILAHELGHAFAVKALTGQETLVVIGLGGYTAWPGYAPARAKVLISLAGPGAGFVLGLIGWLVASRTTEFYGSWPWQIRSAASIWLLALHYLIWASLLWGALNLLPVYPLDGGQALRSLLPILGMPTFRARRLTRRISLAVVVPVGIWALHREAWILVAILLFILFDIVDEARAEGW